MKKLYTLAALLLISVSLHAQVNVKSSGGIPSWSYNTLENAFEAINYGLHRGNISIQLTGSTVETGTARLYASGGYSSYSSVSIRPTVVCSVSGNFSGALIDLNGASHVTIEGRISDRDVTPALTLRNTFTHPRARAITVQFFNGARYNTVRYCNIEGSGQSEFSTNVLMGDTDSTLSYGNSYNVIDHNDIRPANGIGPMHGILSNWIITDSHVANEHNTYSNNLIHGFVNKNPALVNSSAGIELTKLEKNATITGNSLYQPDTVYSSQVYIYVQAASPNIVRDNFIGGSAPGATGHPAVHYSNYGATVTCISLAGAYSNSPDLVDGNVITNFDITGIDGSSSFYGIIAYANIVRIGSGKKNVVGSIMNNDAITLHYIPGVTFYRKTFSIMPITIGGDGKSGTIANNEIGGLTIDAPEGVDGQVDGIWQNSTLDTTRIFNNTITKINSNASAGYLKGIKISYFIPHNQVTYCNNNKIQELTINSTAVTSDSITGISIEQARGWEKYTAVNNITDNLITRLNNYSITSVTGSVRGIFTQSYGDDPFPLGIYQNNNILRNEIFGLITSSTSAKTVVTGIDHTSPYYKYLHIDSNLVHELFSGAVIAPSITAAAVRGISATGPRDEPVTITGNTVHRLFHAANISYAAGIYTLHNGNKNPFLISKNRVYDVYAPYASTGIASGLLIVGFKGAGTYNVQNNMISVSPETVQAYGINLVQTFTAANIYSNTVFVSGVASGNNPSAAFRRRAATTITSVNNIFYNIRTGGIGKHYALTNELTPPATGWTTSDYNDLYSTDTATVALWYNKPLRFTVYRDSSHTDLHSVSVPVQFQFGGTYEGDLHLTEDNPALAAGGPLTPVKDDYDGHLRPAIPTIGADEPMFSLSDGARIKVPGVAALLYPNPTHDYLSVNLSDYHETVIISINDLNGRIIKQQKIPANKLSKTVIDVQGLQAGSYLLTIQSSKGSVSKMFIKH